MAAIATIGGFLAPGLIFVTGATDYPATWVPVMAAIAAPSMLIGAVVALVQTDVRRMLAYSGIAHCGFAMTGIIGVEIAGGVFSDVWATQPWLVLLGVLTSVVTLAFYLRITVIMYMEGEEGDPIPARASTRWVVWIAVGLTILWGVIPGTLLSFVADAFAL